MNIRLDETTIRLRLTENEFYQLKTNGRISYEFDYLPLMVNLELQNEGTVGTIDNNCISLNIKNSEIDLLLEDKTKKDGLSTIIIASKQQQIMVNIQVDLFKN